MAAVLMASVGLNVFLWRELQHQRVDTRAWEARVAEVQASLTEMEASRIQSTNHSTLDVREQARMRNEVGQLRAQVSDAEAKKEEALREAAKLQSQVANAVQKMEGLKKESSELLQMSPEQIAAARERAMAIRCVSNMKQIGLAARLYANDHQNVFPPDLLSMKDELTTPKVLFCPSAGVQV